MRRGFRRRLGYDLTWLNDSWLAKKASETARLEGVTGDQGDDRKHVGRTSAKNKCH